MPIVDSHSELRRISRFVGEQDLARLLDVAGRVLVDLVLRQPRPGRRLAGGVADLRGEVADDEHRGVAELLELTELAQHDGEAEVDVGRGGVDPELGPERPAGPELAAEVGLGDEIDGAGAQDAELLVDGGPMTHERYRASPRGPRLILGRPGRR